MNRKRIIIPPLISSMLLLTLACINVVGAIPEERRTVYSMDFLGLKVSIAAPYLANPGENITVTVRAEASDDVYVEYIYVKIYGPKNETEEIPLADVTHVEKSYLKLPHEVDYVVTIPNDTSPGLLYGIMEMEIDVSGMVMKITLPPAGFVVTYVKNLKLEELQAAYDELNATYHSSLANYTELESKHKGEVSSTRNLMYLFVGTTLVSAATVVVILIRRPKRLWT